MKKICKNCKWYKEFDWGCYLPDEDGSVIGTATAEDKTCDNFEIGFSEDDLNCIEWALNKLDITVKNTDAPSKVWKSTQRKRIGLVLEKVRMM